MAAAATTRSLSRGWAGGLASTLKTSRWGTVPMRSLSAQMEHEVSDSRVEPFQAPSFLDIGTRRIFTPEHDQFRESCRQFFQEHVVPHHDDWEAQGHVSRELWRKAGDMGMLGVNCPEEYGGLGLDFLYSAIVWEEQMYAKGSPAGPGFALHSDIAMPYLVHLGTEEQKHKYLPDLCSGEKILAIAMTEPGAGSDLQGIKTTAAKVDGGFVLNGSKTYITNGWMSDVVIVVAKTAPEKGAHGISLFLVDYDPANGFSKGQPLRKMGLKAQDTCELFFDDLFVPEGNLLGTLNHGFYHLMDELSQERLQIGAECQCRAEAAFEEARRWCNERVAFGKPLFDKQVVRHKLAEMKTSISVNRAFIDNCMELHNEGKLDSYTASMAKLAGTELCWKICDDAVQLHGGAGYMLEYPVARNLADSRVPRIYGGANEIMKELIARSIKID